MNNLLLIILLSLGLITSVMAQSPHGANMKIDCASCHSPKGWEISADYWQDFDPGKPRTSQVTGTVWGPDTLRFHHGKTSFKLEGRHNTVDCRSCHETLVFSGASSDCVSCHSDVHQQSVGTDCARCHTPANWLVDNVADLHLQNGFPLTGVHRSVSCEQCHTAASALQFNRIGNDCISCHLQDYQASVNPNHQQAGFSTDCLECHDVFTSDWGSDNINHDFFPLTKGHEIADCKQCHVGGNYTNTPTNCNACHQQDYDGAQSPNHVGAHFSNDCASCHTTDPDWMPASFTAHDGAYFPIYSGKHKGQWSLCAECHINPSNFAENSCIVCHANPETNDGHAGVNGYVYENSACLACHPTGEAGTGFDHNTTNFPLTGAHLTANCVECHAAGYAGTPTQCSACHTTDFNQAANPNHVALNIPTDCAMCHTTAPGWEPASFPIHNNYYALNGAHAAIANDCAACHNGNYNSTPNTCNGCHNADYVATTSPNHAAVQFPTDCASCHSETAWTPSTFNHNTFYPITGAHIPIANDCNACHNGNYTNTPNTCAGCHTTDFNQASNPNHVALNIPTDCAMCHTTAPGWEPATFPIHNNYHALNGAHAAIANDCAACHNGNYNSTPNTCAGCHTPDYNATTNPNHATLQFSNQCATCHSETTWTPATFDHSVYYPFTGGHVAIAGDCNACHHGDYTNTPNTCNGCHMPDYNASTNPNHVALNLSTNCATCHTTAPDWTPATFAVHNTYWPLTGAHAGASCNQCHANGNYNNTPTDCFGCHASDFNTANNPNHAAAGFPTTCQTCHTTNGWDPSTFNHDQQYFRIYSGNHKNEWDQCVECHTTPGNFTSFSCVECHEHDNPSSLAQDHQGVSGYQYVSSACYNCHPNGN